jgi:hypothetical protein
LNDAGNNPGWWFMTPPLGDLEWLLGEILDARGVSLPAEDTAISVARRGDDAVTLFTVQGSADAAARPGDEMNLTAAQIIALVAAIEAEIADDSTGEAVKQAIVAKLIENLPDLDDLSLAAIAQAVWDRLTSTLTTADTIGKLLVDRIDAEISSRHASGAAVASVTDPVTTDTASRDASKADVSGVATLLSRLSVEWAAAVQASDATVAKQDEILAAIAMRAIGEHAIAVTVTAEDEPLQNALVRTFDGGVLVDRQLTDVSGQCTLQLDAGTYRVVATRSGYQSQTIAELVVTEPADLELELTLLSIPVSIGTGRCTGYAYCYDEDGELVAGETVYAQVMRAASGSGEALDASQRAETSDSGGLVTFTELWIGATYLFRYRDPRNVQHRVTIAEEDVDNGVFAIPNFHG